jgi:hypothetical protein
VPFPGLPEYPFNAKGRLKGQIMNLKNFVTALIVICLWFPATSQAYDQKEALRGLKGVKVTVEYLNPMIERLGLSKTQVKTEVEKQLKKLGVHVFNEAKPPAMSTLYVVVNGLQTKSKATLIYSISVNLVEWAYLKRGIGLVGDLQEVHAINWYKGNIGYMPSDSIKMLMKPLQQLVDKFILDYLAVNQS